MSEHNILIAIGSNINHEREISLAKQLLSKHLYNIISTNPIYTTPIGFDSNSDFLNCLISGLTTIDDIDELLSITKDIERFMGRNEHTDSRHEIIIDIDILLFDNTILHSNDWKRDYIRKMLSDSMIQKRHSMIKHIIDNER